MAAVWWWGCTCVLLARTPNSAYGPLALVQPPAANSTYNGRGSTPPLFSSVYHPAKSGRFAHCCKLQGGPPLFISSFLFVFFVILFVFVTCPLAGWLALRISLEQIPSCGSNRIFFKHHRSQDRLSYFAAFSDLGVGVDWG